jgi:hypothetical protein
MLLHDMMAKKLLLCRRMAASWSDDTRTQENEDSIDCNNNFNTLHSENSLASAR